MSLQDTVAQDKTSNAVLSDTIRLELNKAINDLNRAALTRPAWQVAAAAVAPPVCNIATTASKVKTTATTEMMVDGVLKSLTATDDLWTLTGDDLAIGAVRRYQLCWDGTSATTVVSVRPSNDELIADHADSTAALAACRWPGPPPIGTAIVGVLSIVNVTNAFVPGTTLLSAAGVTDTYRDGPDAACFMASIVTP